MGAWAIAAATFYEASRRKILWAALLLGAVFLVLFALGTRFILHDVALHSHNNAIIKAEVLNSLLLMGLYAVDQLTVLMAVLTSVDTISGEIASGTIQAVATKPIHRAEIVLGKWLGFALLLTIYLTFMSAGVLAAGWGLDRYFPPHAVRGLGLIWLEGMLLLSVTFLGGSYLSTLTNGVLSLSLYGLAFLGGWIEQFGALAQHASAVRVGILASVIFPSESLWRRAAFELQSPLIGALRATPFSSVSVPSNAMITYAALYTLAATILAMRQFSNRDL